MRYFLARSEASVFGLRGDERGGFGTRGGGEKEEEAIVCRVSPLDAGVIETVEGTGTGGAGGLRRRGGGGGGGLLLFPRVSGIVAGAEMTRVAVAAMTADGIVGAGSE